MELKVFKPKKSKSKDIIYNILHDLFELSLKGNSDKENTQLVKITLTKLGHKIKKYVYANNIDEIRVSEINEHLKEIGRLEKGKKGFVNTEWLYDVHWYTDAKKKVNNKVKAEFYMPKTFDLACEIEWNKVRPIYDSKKQRIKVANRDKEEYYLSGLKYDFQKLLVSNADINLFITQLIDIKKEVMPFLDYCNKAIKSYKQLSSNSKFLVVCYVKNEMYYFE